MKSNELKYLILLCVILAIVVDLLDYQLLDNVFKPLTTFLIISLVVGFINSNSFSQRIFLGLILPFWRQFFVF